MPFGEFFGVMDVKLFRIAIFIHFKPGFTGSEK